MNLTLKDGRVGFSEVKELHKHYPMLMYPAFRMQNTLMRESLGDSWWKQKKVMVAEEMRIHKSKMHNVDDDEKNEKELAKQELELELKRMMGPIAYYFMPWKKERYLKKIKKLKKIEAELQAREDFENED